jgi:hypothetical protein
MKIRKSFPIFLFWESFHCASEIFFRGKFSVLKITIFFCSFYGKLNFMVLGCRALHDLFRCLEAFCLLTKNLLMNLLGAVFSWTDYQSNLGLLWIPETICPEYSPGPVKKFYFLLTTKNIFSPCSDVKYCVKTLIGAHLYCSWKYFFFQYQLQRED